jgi:DNA-directed RNA polymerase subunit E'/Rpb7
MMASDAKYDSQANPPCFVSEMQDYRIKKGDYVIVKITGIRFAATEIVRF